MTYVSIAHLSRRTIDEAENKTRKSAYSGASKAVSELSQAAHLEITNKPLAHFVGQSLVIGATAAQMSHYHPQADGTDFAPATSTSATYAPRLHPDARFSPRRKTLPKAIKKALVAEIGNRHAACLLSLNALLGNELLYSMQPGFKALDIA